MYVAVYISIVLTKNITKSIFLTYSLASLSVCIIVHLVILGQKEAESMVWHTIAPGMY